MVSIAPCLIVVNAGQCVTAAEREVLRMASLLHPAEMPPILGVEIPDELYWIIREPAPLAGMRYPWSAPWAEIAAAGFHHIVCLTSERPRYDPSPLRLACATTLEDLFGGEYPRHPAEEERRIHVAVRVVLSKLRLGEGVVVHCEGGVGRTGTVIGCVLRDVGLSSPAVLAYLDAVNKARGMRGWPESPWQAHVVERFQHHG
jgi:protein-tyrosine phosphatase